MARNVRTANSRPVMERLRCAGCGFSWTRPRQGGRRPEWCSDACKQRAYRQREAERREEARRQAEWQEQWEARERARDEEERRRRASSGSSSGFSARRSTMTAAEARRIVFDVAEMADDGTADALRRAWRRAVRRVHPDHNPHRDGEDFKRLERAYDLLKRAGKIR